MVIPGTRRSRFDTTQWTLVSAAGGDQSSVARDALAALCQTYWYPLYAYVRRQGHDVETAQDLTQAFFAMLIEKQDWTRVRRERGRFRSFLLAAMQHFLINEGQKRRALKRGGGDVPLSLEWDTAKRRYLREPADGTTPETVFDRRWALTILDRAMRRVRRDAAEAGKAAEFEALKACLTDDIPHGSYRALGGTVGLSEGAVKTAVHRLRQRFQRALRKEIAETVLSDGDVEAELHHLFEAVTRRA